MSFYLTIAIITGFLQGLSKVIKSRGSAYSKYPNLISYLLFYDTRQ